MIHLPLRHPRRSLRRGELPRRAALVLTPLLGLAWAPLACADNRTPDEVAPPPAAVTPVVVEAAVPPATGRVALFWLTLPPDHPTLASVVAHFGSHRAAVSRWEPGGRRWMILSAVDIEEIQRSLELVVTGRYADGSPLYAVRRFEVQEAPYEHTHIKVDPKYVTPPQDVLDRVAAERADMDRVLGSLDEERRWRGTFHRPTETVETSPFGTLRTYNQRDKKNRHLGLDLDGKTGDPIQAIAAGRVALVQDRYYSGGTVVLDHGQGLVSMYFHMSAFDVEEGQLVEKGQLLGKVGKSGRVTGPHLHLSVKLDGIYTDPKSLLALPLDDDPRLASPPVARQENAAEPDVALGP